MDQEKLGKLFKQRREEKKLTQQELADLIGVTYKAISNWEHGRRLPDYSLLAKVCDALSISLDEIFKMEDDIEDKKTLFDERLEQDFNYFEDAYNVSPPKELDSKYQLDDFVIDKTNRLVIYACSAVAESLGNLRNPLYICGKKGTGKTHVLQGIGNYIKDNYDKKVIYVSSKSFDNNKTSIYKNADVLLIDDIDKYEESNIEELYKLITFFVDNKKQVIVTSNIHPKKLEEKNNKTITWNFVVYIFIPEKETRKEILRKEVNKLNNITIKDEVIDYIVENTEYDNVRKLKIILYSLLSFARVTNNYKIGIKEAEIALYPLFNYQKNYKNMRSYL